MAGKKLKAAYESFDREASFALKDAVAMVKKHTPARNLMRPLRLP